MFCPLERRYPLIRCKHRHIHSFARSLRASYNDWFSPQTRLRHHAPNADVRGPRPVFRRATLLDLGCASTASKDSFLEVEANPLMRSRSCRVFGKAIRSRCDSGWLRSPCIGTGRSHRRQWSKRRSGYINHDSSSDFIAVVAAKELLR